MSIVSAMLAFAGCGGVVYTYDPQTREITNVRRLSRADDFIYESIDSHLSVEKRGVKPPGGHTSWATFWQARIRYWRESADSGYETYYRRRRSEMQLSRRTTS